MTDRPPAVGTHPPCGELAALLAHRQPADLAAEALSLLLAEFGATAASLWYVARPPVGVRQGALSEGLEAHFAAERFPAHASPCKTLLALGMEMDVKEQGRVEAAAKRKECACQIQGYPIYIETEQLT